MQRRTLSLLSLLVAVILVAVAAPSTVSAAVQPGVQAHLMWGEIDGPERDRQLDALQRAGAKVVRVDVGWASLQQDGPGQFTDYHVARLDAVVDGANARGIRPLLTLMETPCWASLAPESAKQGCSGSWWDRGVQKYGPRDPQDYANAAAWVAKRYEGRLAGLELWNEPNHPDFFLGDDRAGRYAALVKAAYPAIKGAAPSTTVVAGSLSESDVDFQSALYANGIAGHYDAFAIHPYNHDASPLTARDGFSVKASFLRGVPAVRANQLAHGDRTPLWLTETGWSTSSVRSEPWASGVDEAVQAKYVEQQAAQLSRWDYVAVAIWFNLKDTTADRSDLVGNYGLMHHDGSAKPAYAAFQRAAALLTSGTRVAEPKAADPTVAVPGFTKPAETPLVVTVSRQTGNLVVSGSAPAGTQTVTVTLHRKQGKKSVKKASYRVKLKPKGKKRTFRRKLPKRLAKRSWKVVATAKVTTGPKVLRAETSSDRAAAKRPFR